MRIKINGNNYLFFNQLNIDLKLDSIASTFSFVARFNPNNENHKKLFKPLSYNKVEIFNDADNLIFTGVIVNHSFASGSTSNLVNVSGYSLPGILEDCTIPVRNYPLESTNRSLKDISERLCGLFGVKVIIDSSVGNDANRVYKKSVASPTDTIKSYLSKLTSQRNVVLSHDNKGRVLLFKPNGESKPKYSFNSQNALVMSLKVNGQGLHSLISVVRQPSSDNAGVSTQDSIENPLIPIFRPTTKVLSSGEDTDTKNAADNELASELKAITLDVELNKLFDDIFPGDIIEIVNPEIYIFSKVNFMVSSVKFSVDNTSQRTSINLVLPETYTSKVPKKIFDL